jgi:D-glycero-alpha-D-manno-heptose 1-phosphate guanylyltransferase
MAITTAIILAGGFGTRLKTVVSDVPKPMAPINGIPFLSYQLNFLKRYGIKHVVISVGYLHEKIMDFYKNEFNGIKIDYVIESEPLGTGGGIRKAIEECENETLLALNGDSFFDIDLHKLALFHEFKNASFSLALRKVANASRYGCIELDRENEIISFQEKSDNVEAGLINAGIYILEPNLYLKHTPSSTKFSIEKDFFEKELQVLPIFGFEFEGYFIDIGIPEDYNKAQHDLKGLTYN